MEQATVRNSIRESWASSVLPSLSELVTIPAVSQNFEPDWADRGQLHAAVAHVRRWLEARRIEGAQVDVVELDGRSPVLLLDVPAAANGRPAEQAEAGTVLLYGHLDKQPPVGGWSEGLGPWTPVVRDGKLFGRGAADDGYSGYAATTAIEAVRAAGGSHSRCVVLLETGEESGSPDLPAYLEHLRPALGDVSLIVCLDSGGQDYDRLWLTTSLRGLVSADLTVRVLESGQHSGLASGIVPSSFRVLRLLLDRLEDARTGAVLLPEMNVQVPEDRLEDVRAVASLMAKGTGQDIFPMMPGMRPVSENSTELVLNNWWRPTLSVIGASGFPEPLDAGNVLRPSSTLTLSFRLPPTADSAAALAALEKTLTTDVPYGARVSLERTESADGWNAPSLAPWLRSTLDDVSDSVFGAPWRAAGLGGSIPFMGLLARQYPDAQFVITGALGPDSNAHVPDEWLHLEHAQRVTESVAHILHAHAGTA